MKVYVGDPILNTDPTIPVVGWRRVLRVGWLHISWEWEARIEDSDWIPIGGDGWSVSITQTFKIGRYHTYYDGPLCFLSLGWVHILRRNWNCAECMDDA